MMNQDFKDALAEYSKTITELNTELNDKDAEISRLNEALTAAKEKNILLSASLRQAEDRIDEMDSDLKANASMLAKQCDLARDAESRAETAEAKLKEAREAYNDLIFSVGKKYANESRHETAKRYILGAESVCETSAKEAIQEEPKSC